MQRLLAKLNADSFEVVALLSVLVVVIYGSDEWPITSLGAVLLTLAVLKRDILTSYLFWLSMSGLTLFTFGLFWSTAGDGFILQIYWCITLLLALLTPEREKTLAEMARLLIGTVFLLTVVSKLISPDFVSGAFFEVFLVRDLGRVGLVGVLLTDLSVADIASNIEAARRLPEQSVKLTLAPGIHQLAILLTIATLLVESAVATAFLLKFPERIRNTLFILFLAGTYLIAPVVVFGTTLAIMGFAQASSPRVRLVYLFFVLFIQLTPLRTYIALLFLS